MQPKGTVILVTVIVLISSSVCRHGAAGFAESALPCYSLMNCV